tara:strand:- start:93 stop:527 length:435 start_codon:yes stop_codon:yes gene_type:complete
MEIPIAENVKQFKLSDGEEIIAEIIEDHEEEIILRTPLRVIRIDVNFEKTLYTFKPWMTYVEATDHFVSLNDYHIMSATHPHEELLTQYKKALKKIRELENNPDYMKPSEEDVGTSLEDYDPESLDSNSSNIIDFKSIDRSKLH